MTIPVRPPAQTEYGRLQRPWVRCGVNHLGEGRVVVRRSPGLSTLTDRLLSMNSYGHFRYLGTNRRDGERAVELPGDRIREYPAVQMLHWLDGFGAGLLGEMQPPVRRNPAALAEIRSVLVNPSLADQARIRVRVAMEDNRIGVVELAERVGVTKKSLRQALRFGPSGTTALAFQRMTGPDLEQHLRPDLAATRPDAPITLSPADGWREPRHLTALRLLGYAHEQGVIRFAEPLDVNQAMYTQRFSVAVDDHEVQVRLDAVRPWLTGVADAIAPEIADRLYVPPPPGCGLTVKY